MSLKNPMKRPRVFAFAQAQDADGVHAGQLCQWVRATGDASIRSGWIPRRSGQLQVLRRQIAIFGWPRTIREVHLHAIVLGDVDATDDLRDQDGKIFAR
ncbi:hypothetical protein B0H67DRAFT_649244 [Lasiosphaeris hirsuta]|uniref:Uncharacterized protein n=1 Tax=Lasiosphaeris hirsuta TaxID=260670 RepID=A0AA39ZWB1_9PEZI|nr:hypothetical protein B0H67DRAFT_649244 [Lasiosphaeris hirsuta]